MSGVDDHIGDEGDSDDTLAAEYVLGVLDHAARLGVTARLRTDDALAARVAAWEAQLAPLADEILPLPAPNLLPAIEARLFGKPAEAPDAAPARAASWLRGWLAGGALAAVVLGAGLLLLPPAQKPTTVAATLAAENQPLVIAAVYDGTEVIFTRTGGPVADAGHDYELWIIDATGVPVTLGVLGDAPHHAVVPGLVPGVTLAVTLETAGGSPDGTPHGPVLVTGIVSETITSL